MAIAILILFIILAIIALYGLFVIIGNLIGVLLTLIVAGLIGALADAIVPGDMPFGFFGAILAGRNYDSVRVSGPSAYRLKKTFLH